MTTKDRLITFLAYINISQGRFEKGVGLSTGFVNNVGDSIRKSSLDKISSVYPELNTAWLLTGVGNMINENKNKIYFIKKKSLLYDHLFPAMPTLRSTFSFCVVRANKRHPLPCSPNQRTCLFIRQLV